MGLPVWYKPMQDVGRTQEKLVNHRLKASDLQALRVFSQHPKVGYQASKPIESLVYTIAFIKISNFR